MKMPSRDDLMRLSEMPETPILISGLDMFYLLGGLQLLLRLPGFQKIEAAKIVRAFADALEERIVKTAPAFKDVCAAGWDPGKDIEE